jgi:hypothetical protein
VSARTARATQRNPVSKNKKKKRKKEKEMHVKNSKTVTCIMTESYHQGMHSYREYVVRIILYGCPEEANL